MARLAKGAPHGALPPSAGIGFVADSCVGLMLVSCARAPSATQIVSLLPRTSLGYCPTFTAAARTVRFAGSIRDTDLSSTFVVQALPAPVVIASGARPTGTSAVSVFDDGSMTPTESGETVPSPPEPPVRRNAAVAASTRSATPAAIAMRVLDLDIEGSGASPSRSAERVAATSSPADR